MIRFSALAAFALLAIAVYLNPTAAPSAVPTAKPTPVGLQYDEIVRMAVPPGTPPPPGSFQPDYAAILHPAANPDDTIDADAAAAMKSLGIKIPGGIPGFGNGTLARYAFYKGWVRVDDLVAHTAEIRKCDVRQFIELDLNKKTYHMESSSTAATPSFGNVGAQAGSAGEPGAASMTISRKTSGLGPMTLEGVATKGYSVVNTMTIARATGSCQNGNFTSIQTEYISGIRQPRAFCTLSNPAIDAGMGSSTGGCRPTFSYRNVGPAPPSDRLVMYSRMAILPPNATGESAAVSAFVTERGNVRVLYQPDAVALFTVPADFTQQP